MTQAARSHQLRCVRSDVTLSAEVRATETRRPEFFAGLVNLSGTGCLLDGEGTLNEGDLVTLRFSLPGQAEIETTGRVARLTNGQVGIAFQELNDASSDKIVCHVVKETARRR